MDQLLPLIIIALVVVLAVLFVMQRRRRAKSEVVSPPDLGQPIDYTSPEFKEPETAMDRIRNAPLALKLLVPLGAIALLIVAFVLFSTLQPIDTGEATPTPAPSTLTEASAALRNATSILVQANTNLPDNTSVQAALLEDGQPFDWNTPESGQGQVRDGRVRITLNKRQGAPTPSRDRAYTVTLSATGADGAALTTEPAELSVPQFYDAAFYAPDATAAEPTAAPTEAPAAATAIPTATPQAAPTVEATPTATAALTATVANGGNVRAEPTLNGQVLDQNNAFEEVTLLQRTADGAWYQMTNPRGVTGWFSASLLTIDPEVAGQVPVEGTVPAEPPTVATTQATTEANALTGLVRNGGNVRRSPNLSGEVLDQNNAGEIVQLISKTADGTWYQVTNPRGITGWFSASLLTIDPDTAAQVPVEE